MKSSRHGMWWRVVVLLTLTSLILAACGGNQQAESPAPIEEQSPPPAGEAPSPADEASPAGIELSPEASPAGIETSPSPEGEASPSPDDEASPSPGGGASPVAEASPGAQAEGPPLNADVSGTIEFWHFWGSPQRRNAINRVIAICQQQLPNIQVNATFKPFGDIWTANIAAVAAGSGMPDVIVEDRPQLKQRAEDGIATNLGEFAERDGIDGSQFWPFTWEQTLYEGEPYGIPYETDVRVLYWNKDAFREVGLDPEQPPTTWEELEQYADQLDVQNEDGSYERIGFSPLIGNVGPEVWGYTNGVVWISEDGEPQINTPEAVETLEWIKGWIDRYGGWQNHQNFRAQFQAPPNDAFMSGKVAMFVDINGYTATLDFYRPRVEVDGEQKDLEFGVSDIPYDEAKASTSGGFALSIPQGAPNAEAAWEWIKCATGPEAQASWARDTYAMPANQAAANDPVLLADPRWQFFVDAMSYSTGGNYLEGYPNWGQELGNRYEQVWTGELSPEEALEQAQQAVEAEIGQ